MYIRILCCNTAIFSDNFEKKLDVKAVRRICTGRKWETEKGNRPEEFQIDIGRAAIVKVEFVQLSGHAGMDTGWYTETRGYIANAVFVKE